MGDHPIAWFHEVELGKAYYTGLGHTSAQFESEAFLSHLEGAIAWSGDLDIAVPQWQGEAPSINDFSLEIKADSLNQPMELDIAQSGEIYVIGRLGDFYVMVDDELNRTSSIEVNSRHEGGLIGFALDPDFTNNRYAYFHYTAPTVAEHKVSRINIAPNNTLDLASEIVLLSYPVQITKCCHNAGSMAFDSQGNLYIATGDNTNPFNSQGYAPIDERSGRSDWDAQKSSSNTNDMRGKVIRIKPAENGGYSIPEGNLFSADSTHLSEIFTMGHRNPFRITIDSHDNTLYLADIGPDANSNNPSRGPAGVDELNKIQTAGNYGWPYFTGNNNAYNDFDFATNVSGVKFDANAPFNASPNNSGAQTLPVAKPAWLSLSHRALMVADVYRYNNFVFDEYKLPSYFDGKLLYWNFNNDQMFEVDTTANAAQNTPNLRRWLNTDNLDGIIDGKVSPFNNRLYLIAFGGNCCGKVNDAGVLAQVKYMPGQATTPPVDSLQTHYAINTGGNDFQNAQNVLYEADKYASSGRKYSNNNSISGTDDDTLMQSHHWDSATFEYALPLADGEYTVKLEFAEIFYDEVGRRIFSVDAEDVRQITDIDVFAEVGMNALHSHSFTTSVNDGMLNISFIKNIQNPMVSSITVSPTPEFADNTAIIIVSEHSGQYLGLTDNSGQIAFTAEVATEEETFIIELGDGYVQIKNLVNGLYLGLNDDNELVYLNSDTGESTYFEMIKTERDMFALRSILNQQFVAFNDVNQHFSVSANNIATSTLFSINQAEVCDANNAHAIACRPNAKAYLDMPIDIGTPAAPDFSKLPLLLSQTGAFEDIQALIPSPSLLPYTPIQPSWADRSVRKRWVAVPSGTKVVYSEQDRWTWPAGTVFVKHFDLPTNTQDDAVLRRLETRINVVQENGEIYGVTYRWREDYSDAELLTQSLEEFIEIATEQGPEMQKWVYPSPGDCLVCHNPESSGVLGLKSATINHSRIYESGIEAQQLSVFNQLELFTETLAPNVLTQAPKHVALDDQSHSLETRMRTYWDVNCSSCHGPQGIAALWDARYSTSLAMQGVVRGPLANQRDYLNDYGLASPFVVDPKNKSNPILYIRDKSVDANDRMPPLAKELEDKAYIEALVEWIDSLD
jgi:glucose/arabinose dehydrogenase